MFLYLQDQQQAQGHQQLLVRPLPEEKVEDGQKQQVPGVQAVQVKLVLQPPEQVGEAEARRMIRRKDKEREQYFRYFTQKNWADRANYDIQLNTSTMPMQQCAELLAALARAGQ